MSQESRSATHPSACARVTRAGTSSRPARIRASWTPDAHSRPAAPWSSAGWLRRSGRSSATVRGYFVSGGLDYDQQTAREAVTRSLSGFFAISSYRNFTTQIRASLDYDLMPEFRAKALALTVDHQLNPLLSVRFGVGGVSACPAYICALFRAQTRPAKSLLPKNMFAPT